MRVALARPAILLFLLSGVLYTFYIAGERPQYPTYERLLPFQVAAEQPSVGPSADLTRQTLLVEQRTRTGQTQPFFDDPPALGYFSVFF